MKTWIYYPASGSLVYFRDQEPRETWRAFSSLHRRFGRAGKVLPNMVLVREDMKFLGELPEEEWQPLRKVNVRGKAAADIRKALEEAGVFDAGTPSEGEGKIPLLEKILRDFQKRGYFPFSVGDYLSLAIPGFMNIPEWYS